MERLKAVRIIQIIIIAIAIVGFWRGIWGFMDLYLFPDFPVLSYLASISIGIIVLIITRYIQKLL